MHEECSERTTVRPHGTRSQGTLESVQRMAKSADPPQESLAVGAPYGLGWNGVAPFRPPRPIRWRVLRDPTSISIGSSIARRLRGGPRLVVGRQRSGCHGYGPLAQDRPDLLAIETAGGRTDLVRPCLGPLGGMRL